MKGILLIVAAAAVLAGCAGKGVQKVEAKQVRNVLEINPSEDLVKQIKLGPVEWKPVNGTLRVAGRVEADETRMATVSAPVTGRIVELETYEGQQVKRGQVLATIYSTELSSSQSSFLKARSQKQLAERAVSRAKQLLEAGVIGDAEVQRREAELQQAEADLAAAREQLAVLGLSPAEISALEVKPRVTSTSHILSTIDGTVLERKATIGQVVQAVETVFVIADLSNVWLEADVPEQSAGAIHVGKAVEAEIPALPGEKITGKLSFVSSIVNPETRTVRTRMNLPNPKRMFKPAMLATITLMDGAERKRVVPSTAVVREGNADHVFVKTGDNTFTLRAVTLGEEYQAVREVISGLKDGEMIVTDGAFHMNNERKRLALGGDEGD